MSNVHSQSSMTKKQLSILAITLTVLVIGITVNQAFATSVTNYKVTDDTYTRLTFTFRDATEVTYFPVFKMTTGLVINEQPSFQIEGIVGDYPHLHKAMDEAYKYRAAQDAIQYNYKYFVVDVDFIKNGVTQKSLHYNDCQVTNAKVNTLTDNAEGYTTTKTGFAIVDTIDFACTGLDLKSQSIAYNTDTRSDKVQTYPASTYKMAENVQSWATFRFNEGVEKINFPVYKMETGFDETSVDRPSFILQGIPAPHVLLDNAVNNAKKIAGTPSNVINNQFDVDVEFTNGNEIFRTLQYTKCTVDDYTVDTQTDSEEGYTGKSGFAVTENYTVSCSGLTTSNHPSTSKETNSVNPYLMGGRTHAITTITLESGEKESIDTPIYKQTSSETSVQTSFKKKLGGGKTERWSRYNPTFEIQAVHSETPILFGVADLIRTRGQISGTDFQTLFAADVELIHDDKIVVKHHYDQCRVTKYTATTLYNKEEGYVGANGFAQVGTYDFECKGYEPQNPAYDALFVIEKADTQSTSQLRDTSEWNPSFKYSGKY